MSFMTTLQSALGVEVVSPTWGDPDARRLQLQLAAGDFQSTAAVFRTLRDWDERDFFVRALSEAPGRPEWVEAWTRAKPDSADAWLLRSVHTVQWAWEARGSGYAETVGDNAFKVFHARLRHADGDFRRAVELDPADPTPWAHWMWAGIGGQIGIDHIRQRHDEATRRHKHHRTARQAMFQALCAKWYGSAEQMFAYVREACSDLPEGHGLHFLIPQAHYERWLQHWREKDRRAANKYLRQTDVRDEIMEAARRSILSPHYEPNVFTNEDRNWFAWAFSAMGENAAACRQFRRLGRWVATPPWGAQAEVLHEFRTARRNSGGPFVRLAAVSVPFLGLNLLGIVMLFVAFASLAGAWTAAGRPQAGPLNAVFGFLVGGADWSYRKTFLGGSLLDEAGGRLLNVPLWCWGALWVAIGLVQTAVQMLS